MQECLICEHERKRGLQEAHAVHAANPKTGTLRSLFTSLSHESFGRSGMYQFAQGHRGALVMNFCIECELNDSCQSFSSSRLT